MEDTPNCFTEIKGKIDEARKNYNSSPIHNDNQSTNFSSTGPIFYPYIAKRVVELVFPALVLKPLLQDFFIIEGTTASIPKQRGQRAYSFTGPNQSVDYTPLDLITVVPYRIALRIRITRELLEDNAVNIIEDQLPRAARRVVASIETDIEKCFREAATVINIDRKYFKYRDLDKVKEDFESNGLGASVVYVVNPLRRKELNRLGVHNIRVSPHVSVNDIYVISEADCGACYAPLGYFVTKRPISVDVWPQPVTNAIDIVISARYAPVVVYPEAIVRLHYPIEDYPEEKEAKRLQAEEATHHPHEWENPQHDSRQYSSSN